MTFPVLTRLALWLSALIALSGTFGISGSLALEIEIRPDLKPRLEALRRLYPAGSFVEPGPSVFDELTVFRLSGVIEKGDADKLARAFEGKWGKAVVFDSPGGNFLEGIRIGKMLQENVGSQDPDLTGVFVLEGDKCLSACALAMTLAATPRNIYYREDIRFIEAGAELGFHMGFLPEDKARQLGEVQRAMDLAYEVTRTFAQLIKGGLAPSILLEEALVHRTADSFFYLRGGIRSYAMGLSPVASGPLARPVHKSAMTGHLVASMCQNIYVAAGFIPKSEVQYEFAGIQVSQPDPYTSGIEGIIREAGGGRIAAALIDDAFCMAELTDDGLLALQVESGPVPCNRQGGWCAVPKLDDPAPLPLATTALLADTLGCHRGRLMRQGQYWQNDVLTYENAEEWPFTDDWQRTAARSVNLRASPSLSAAKVGELAAGQKVQIADCRVVDDIQGVWYRLTGSGRDQWVSARFFRETNVFARPAED